MLIKFKKESLLFQEKILTIRVYRTTFGAICNKVKIIDYKNVVNIIIIIIIVINISL